MRIRTSLFLAALLTAVAVAGAIAEEAPGPAVYEARWAEVGGAGGYPADLLRPEGKSRWDLLSLNPSGRWTRTLHEDPAESTGLVVVDRREGQPQPTVKTRRLIDPAGANSARSWLAPHLGLNGGTPVDATLLLDETIGGTTERLWIRTQRVGAGWVHLPSGPREVVLERALVLRRTAQSAGYEPELLVHRWVDPRAGEVARSWGPPSVDGRQMTEIRGAAYVEQVLLGGLNMKIHVDQFEPTLFGRVNYGFDRGDPTPVSSVDPAAHATIGDLVAASSWDFSGNNLTNHPGMEEVISTTTPVCESPGVNCETCSWNQCGFTAPGNFISREDKNFGDPFTVTALEREDRASDVTYWLRATVRNEGETQGGLGENESRVCYDGGGRTEVPLWRFDNEDVDGFYMQVGDSWSHAPFDCEQTLFSGNCPGGTINLLTDPCGDHSGTQFGEVVNEGPVTLPSGHTFNALVAKNVADFCVYAGACIGLFEFAQVRTVIYLWEVPYIGTVARLMSATEAPDATSFTTLAETDIKFGLFPPLSITVGTVGETTVDLSWDPGLDTHRIDSYRVYWNTVSGAVTPYDPLDSVVSLTPSATVTGLDPSTQYFFTVTTMSEFTDPTTGQTRSYESLLFPTQVSGGPQPLPQEVSATTTGACSPSIAVNGVTASKVAGEVELCWDPVVDCIDGYSILGADDPTAAGNFSVVVPDTGLVTCHTFDPSETYFLVVGKGPGGSGPWAHYGQ